MDDLEFPEVFRQAVERQVRANHQAIDDACIAALTTGDRGVMVATHNDGTVTASVSPDVPYGEIHYLPLGL